MDDKCSCIDDGSIKEMLKKKEMTKVQWISRETVIANVYSKNGTESLAL